MGSRIGVPLWVCRIEGEEGYLSGSKKIRGSLSRCCCLIKQEHQAKEFIRGSKANNWDGIRFSGELSRKPSQNTPFYWVSKEVRSGNSYRKR